MVPKCAMKSDDSEFFPWLRKSAAIGKKKLTQWVDIKKKSERARTKNTGAGFGRGMRRRCASLKKGAVFWGRRARLKNEGLFGGRKKRKRGGDFREKLGPATLAKTWRARREIGPAGRSPGNRIPGSINRWAGLGVSERLRAAKYQ